MCSNFRIVSFPAFCFYICFIYPALKLPPYEEEHSSASAEVISREKLTLAQLYNCMQIETLPPPLILEANSSGGGGAGGDKSPNLGQGMK